MHEAFRSVHSLSLIVSFMQLFSLFLAKKKKKRLKYNITFDLKPFVEKFFVGRIN